VAENKKQEEMVKEAVEEAKAKAVKDVEETGEEVFIDSEALDSMLGETAKEEVVDFLDDEDSLDEEGFLDDEDSLGDEEFLDDEDEAGEEMKEESGAESNVKRFFQKKKDKKDEKIEELTDRLTRQMAEFDNFRKRTEKEKSRMYEIGARDIVEKLLDVLDNFERGLSAVPEDKKEDPYVEGMDMIYKQMMTTLEDAGVKVIEAVGNEFNPDFHNAVMHVEDEEQGENIVIEEFQKGYMYRDTVVRHSMVKVAN